MRFDLVDKVLEVSPEGATTIKTVSLAEEYLQDHFPSFPVLPGVLMLEAMVQAARLAARERGLIGPLVLGEVRALKYNRFVTPGGSIRVVAEVSGQEGEELSFRGRADLIDAGGAEPQIAATGRFMLRPVRVEQAGVVGAAARGA